MQKHDLTATFKTDLVARNCIGQGPLEEQNQQNEYILQWDCLDWLAHMAPITSEKAKNSVAAQFVKLDAPAVPVCHR